MPVFSAFKSLASGAGSHLIAKGYWGGGFDVTAQNDIEGLDFINETILNPAANLGTGRYGLGACNNATNAYFGGGFFPSVNVAAIDGFIFASEAANNPSVNLPTPRARLTALSAKLENKGYFLGGGLYSSEIDGIDMATEIAINPAAALTVAQAYLSGTQNLIKGYASQGFTGSAFTNDMQGFIFASETIDGSSGSLTYVRQGTSAITNRTKSFWMGGGGTLLFFGSQVIDGFIYSTETPTIVSDLLSKIVDRSHSGVSAVTKGYMAGGSAHLVVHEEIEEFLFSTETSDEMAAILNIPRFWTAGAQPWAQY